RRTTVQTPVHRFQTRLDMTGFGNRTQWTNDVGFLFEVHGQVRVVPITEYTHTHEVFLLQFNLGVGIFTAGFTEGRGIYLDADFTDFFFNFEFDWQTVTVPARYIGCIKTIHHAAFDDDVF